MILPTKDQWYALASSRMLLVPRPLHVPLLFISGMTALLMLHAPIYVVILWTLLAVATNFWMRRLTRTYSDLLGKQSGVMTDQMTHIVQRYKTSWYVNSVIWGSTSVISQIWLPDATRVACTVVLNALMFLFITRTGVYLAFMYRISAIIIILSFLSPPLRFAFNQLGEQAYLQLMGFTFYLGLTWYMLSVVGMRFHLVHRQQLNFEYDKLQLIQSLEHSQQQLRLEQQALIDANSVIQQFYSSAAHDLRQPVYAMQLYTEMLIDDPSRHAMLLPKISQSCSSINAMFNTLFDFQKMHLDDMHLEKKNINIAEVFESLSLHFEPIASVKNLRIKFRPLPGSVSVVPLYLIRILSNLITNALRYTAAGGVLICARQTKTHLSFEVWDTGIGIAPEMKEHIFTEFFKINPSNVTTENLGLGLGLSIVRQLATRLDGADILVQSQLARGSVFKLRLPISLYSAS